MSISGVWLCSSPQSLLCSVSQHFNVALVFLLVSMSCDSPSLGWVIQCDPDLFTHIIWAYFVSLNFQHMKKKKKKKKVK